MKTGWPDIYWSIYYVKVNGLARHICLYYVNGLTRHIGLYTMSVSELARHIMSIYYVNGLGRHTGLLSNCM